MSKENISLIRKIYLEKKSFFDYPELHKILFNIYYPNLVFEKYKFADIWFSCVFSDFCGDLMSINNTEKIDEDGINFNDIPGPVG